ncbi:MAG: APC family permease [Acidobacteriaceae bacterium]
MPTIASFPQSAAAHTLTARPTRIRRLRLLALVAATYFMVSGGPYGLEDIVGQAGYARALLLLLIVPAIWSLPTALMIGELASALPEEGGFYIWVERALGRFWGFQEAWLSLAASVFDMAVYPALAVAYLTQLYPALTAGERGLAWSLGIVVLCVAWNLRGAYSVGQGSLWMLALLLTPFLGIVGCGLWHIATHPAISNAHFAGFAAPLHGSMTIALLFVLWNYMGWDNASTIAREVENPRRNYIRAMLYAVTLVAASYILPIAVVAFTGIPAATFVTGSWVSAARVLATGLLGSRVASWLAFAVLAGGALTGVAMFNALTLSYARVPAAMAVDGMLPRVLARRMKNGVPWVAVLACAGGWALALGLNLTRLLELDIMLYGLSLMLEFIALVVLRMREPALARPFRVPGGVWMAISLGVAPSLLIFFTIWAARGDRITPHLPAIALGAMIAVAGTLAYPLTLLRKSRRTPVPDTAA